MDFNNPLPGDMNMILILMGACLVIGVLAGAFGILTWAYLFF